MGCFEVDVRASDSGQPAVYPLSSVEVGVVRRSHPRFYWSNRVLMQRLAPLNATVGPPECNGWPP